MSPSTAPFLPRDFMPMVAKVLFGCGVSMLTSVFVL